MYKGYDPLNGNGINPGNPDPAKEARKKEIKAELKALQKKREKKKYLEGIKSKVATLKKAKADEELRQRYITSAKEEAYHRAWEERKYGNK